MMEAMGTISAKHVAQQNFDYWHVRASENTLTLKARVRGVGLCQQHVGSQHDQRAEGGELLFIVFLVYSRWNAAPFLNCVINSVHTFPSLVCRLVPPYKP